MTDSEDQPLFDEPHALNTIRTEYSNDSLDTEQPHNDPIELFKSLLNQAMSLDLATPNACTLATASPSGLPSARIVLLRDVSAEGFSFYTNYESRKGKELARNPQAAMLFFWDAMEIQIRIEGTVNKLSPEQSDAYFSSRPRGSQFSACASPQSDTVPDRAFLEARVDELNRNHGDESTIARPAFWGGYCVKPRRIEFWKGRPNRLHDRWLYELNSETDTNNADTTPWSISRLAP